MIDHAHLIGLATDHLISHAHQLSKEGVASGSSSSESLLEGGAEEEGRERHKRSSVTGEIRAGASILYVEDRCCL